MGKSKALFIKKALVSMIMAPTALTIIYFGYPFLHLSLLIVGAMLAYEWANMVPSKNKDVYALTYLLGLIMTMCDDTYVGVGIMGLMTVFVAFKTRKEPKRFLLTLGVPYIAFGIASLAWLYDTATDNSGFWMILWLLIVVWSMDTGGYIFGSLLKGPKLAPKISPNKTWSGAIGGAFLAVALSSLMFFLIGEGGEYLQNGVMAFVIAWLAQIGDLVESAIKRNVGVKDSSAIIPGHGGVFDRLDSLIFVAPLLYAFLRFGYLLFNGVL